MKKLIEVSMPLDVINEYAGAEKSVRHGHPSTIHVWWARRPLAACKAVLFAQLVDDPSEYASIENIQSERKRLHQIIGKLVPWKNVNDDRILSEARFEIAKSIERNGGPKISKNPDNGSIRKYLSKNGPPTLDPFCGGGSIPLESQRLGLKSQASDLNPVAVMINKALIELPPKFTNKSPVNPDSENRIGGRWIHNSGLAEDVLYYGKWIHDEAKKRIGSLYPNLSLPNGTDATVIAWLWARSIVCPNPTCKAEMPLVSSFQLSNKRGKEVWIDPLVNQKEKTIKFKIHHGNDKKTSPTVVRTGAKCIFCESPVPFQHVRNEAKSGRMGVQATSIVVQSSQGQMFFETTKEMENIALQAEPNGCPETNIPEKALGISVQAYGMVKHKHLFTSRQLVALTTFSQLIDSARKVVMDDAIERGYSKTDAKEYANAVSVYLSFAQSRSTNYWSKLNRWGKGFIGNTFGRHALSMVWDYAEANVFSNSTGNWLGAVDWIHRSIISLPQNPLQGTVSQNDVISADYSMKPVISTDPPYYDNIGYADLSDYFYTWLRLSLKDVYPEIFSTMLVPKSTELIADPNRHESKDKAQDFFMDGMSNAMRKMANESNSDYPITLYYAFKQAELNEQGLTSTGWETFLQAIINSNLSIVGTWPLRTERTGRLRARNSNALASSIVLVCRKRSDKAPIATRREFISELQEKLPDALRTLQESNIAPVDMAQSAIGPGIGIYSKYSKVVGADGNRVSVGNALAIINEELDRFFEATEGDMDGESRFCVTWFQQYGFDQGQYGEAETLVKARNTSVDGLVNAGVVKSSAGKVRLLRSEEMDEDWDPRTDERLTLWECVHHLCRSLSEGGETAAGALVAAMGSGKAEESRDLAYRLYSICDRNSWTPEAQAYNDLVTSWDNIKNAAPGIDPEGPQQTLF